MASVIRALVRAMLSVWRRLRFRAWAARVRLELRLRAGARLIVDAPHGAILDSAPRVTVFALGDGSGTFTVRIGRGVRLGRDLTIELWARGDNLLEIGDESFVMDRVRLILRSGRISLGARCNVRDGVWLKSDGELVLGDDVPVAQYSAIHCAHRIELADFAGLAERVTILDSDHSVDGSDTYFRDQPLRVGSTTVGRNTFIAANAIVLRDAEIGANSLVAANSVVRGGGYPDSSIIAGAPAQVVRELAPGEREAAQASA